MSKIEKLIATNTVLAKAGKAKLKRVVVIGVTEDGSFYAAASGSTVKAMADIAEFERRLISGKWDDPIEKAA